MDFFSPDTRPDRVGWYTIVSQAGEYPLEHRAAIYGTRWKLLPLAFRDRLFYQVLVEGLDGFFWINVSKDDVTIDTDYQEPSP
jgi:hypothetical protein